MPASGEFQYHLIRAGLRLQYRGYCRSFSDVGADSGVEVLMDRDVASQVGGPFVSLWTFGRQQDCSKYA